MCGIAGIFGTTSPDEGRIKRALASMRHRGPDACGVFRGVVGNNAITLLHSRLSIIDLTDRANQPFEAEDCVIVFNGEIYNYRELREELTASGARFRTDSDTEVIVRAYRSWGLAAFARFEGMWAFALLDGKMGHLILSRDRFGEKPLFFQKTDDALYFASEIKTLAALSGQAPQVDRNQLLRYLVYDFRALYKAARSHFANVEILPDASVAVVDDPGRVEPVVYWRLTYQPQAMTVEAALAGVRERLERAVEHRLRADVPIAFCLSGGVDSTTLACIAAKRFGQKVHTFSILDADERYDERVNIEKIVRHLGCDHHAVETSSEGFLDRMTRLVQAHDAPVATISYYVHSFLSELISDNGYKVAISGTGADELFTGYYDHYALWLAEMSGRADFSKLLADWRSSFGVFVNNPLLQDPLAFAVDPSRRDHLILDHDRFRSFLTRDFEEAFVEEAVTENLLRNRMINELRHEIVPVILKEDDLNSMMVSVENRSPYLDRELAEFLYTVPSEHLIRDGYSKWLLREAGAGIVPDEVRLDRRKRGFNAPIDSLLDRSDPEIRERLLEPSPIFDYVHRPAVESMLDSDLVANSASKFMFRFVSTKLFLESPLATGRLLA